MRSDSLQGERIALELPKNPNVTEIVDILKVQLGSIEGDRALVIMEKLCPGNLLTLLNDDNAIFDTRTCLSVSAQITSGLLFCHQLGILHLDVKPQNILIDCTGQYCKLSDFGNARRVSDLGNSSKILKLEGTVIYKAPELFRGFCPTEKSDIFSMGITMWQILSREFPYRGENEHSVIYKVVAQGLRPRIYPDGPPQTKLCEICWDEDPIKRPNAAELLDRLNYLQVQTFSQDRQFFYSKLN